MVYLHPPGPSPKVRARARDAGGLPLWFLTSSSSTLRGMRAPREEVPPDRRHLRGWARSVRALEVNVEVSDLGTVLQARYRVPEGLWLHSLLVGHPRVGPPLRFERVERVGDPPLGPLELLSGTVRYEVRVERQGQEEGR